MDFEKRHCCCCVRLPDGVMLVGLYGVAVHAALLVVDLWHGGLVSIPVETRLKHEALQPAVTAANVVGVAVNGFLVFGAYFSLRLLMLPWLAAQGLLALLLASLALYYLLLFPHIECPNVSPSLGWTPSKVECTFLLWHAVVLILCVVLVLYYAYVVSEFAASIRLETKVRRMMEMPLGITIEKRKNEEDQEDQEEEQEATPIEDEESSLPSYRHAVRSISQLVNQKELLGQQRESSLLHYERRSRRHREPLAPPPSYYQTDVGVSSSGAAAAASASASASGSANPSPSASPSPSPSAGAVPGQGVGTVKAPSAAPRTSLRGETSSSQAEKRPPPPRPPKPPPPKPPKPRVLPTLPPKPRISRRVRIQEPPTRGGSDDDQ